MFLRNSLPRAMSALIGSHPCQSCGRELHLKSSRKVCNDCQSTFCNRCVIVTGDHFSCHKCQIFNSDLMTRSKLEGLSPSDLRYYYYSHHLEVPTRDNIPHLVEGILVHQAQLIAQRAIDAQMMLNDPTLLGDRDFVTKRTQTPPTSRGASSNSTPLINSTGIPATTNHTLLTSSSEPSFIRRKDFVPGSVTNVNDLQCEEEIDLLPVKILKIILQRNCIDYRGCVEKEELRERVKRLWKARVKQKLMEDKIAGDIDAENEFLCKICMDEPVDCVLLDCGHMLSCVKCGRQLNECPVCRQYIIRVVHAFKV